MNRRDFFKRAVGATIALGAPAAAAAPQVDEAIYLGSLEATSADVVEFDLTEIATAHEAIYIRCGGTVTPGTVKVFGRRSV